MTQDERNKLLDAANKAIDWLDDLKQDPEHLGTNVMAGAALHDFRVIARSIFDDPANVLALLAKSTEVEEERNDYKLAAYVESCEVDKLKTELDEMRSQLQVEIWNAETLNGCCEALKIECDTLRSALDAAERERDDKTQMYRAAESENTTLRETMNGGGIRTRACNNE
jgi:chromosome segregation ATPase